MLSLTNKKGLGLGDLYPTVIAIIIVGIALGIGIFILNETGDAISTHEFTVLSENVTVTDIPTAVATATDCGFQTFVVTEAAGFNGTLIPAAQYTTSGAFGTIANVSSNQGSNNVWTVNYTYTGATTGSNYCSSLTTTSTGVGGMAAWISVIVVVLAAAIVLGIVTRSFGGRAV
jgi:hypothetical protein|tara:strand:- start:2958 stop:3479 length:522 start_codon:yes stop_codon:yes gene_type:complete